MLSSAACSLEGEGCRIARIDVKRVECFKSKIWITQSTFSEMTQKNTTDFEKIASVKLVKIWVNSLLAAI